MIGHEQWGQTKPQAWIDEEILKKEKSENCNVLETTDRKLPKGVSNEQDRMLQRDKIIQTGEYEWICELRHHCWSFQENFKKTS